MLKTLSSDHIVSLFHCHLTTLFHMDFPCASPRTAVGCLEVHSAKAAGNGPKAIITVEQQQLLEEIWSIWRMNVILLP